MVAVRAFATVVVVKAYDVEGDQREPGLTRGGEESHPSGQRRRNRWDVGLNPDIRVLLPVDGGGVHLRADEVVGRVRQPRARGIQRRVQQRSLVVRLQVGDTHDDATL